MELALGSILALMIGLSLGILGAGGSILTLPVLVYVMGIPAQIAAGYSLGIVGLSAAMGSWQNLHLKRVRFIPAMLFALPAIATVLLMRRIILPTIPASFSIAGIIVSLNSFSMIFFAVLMAFSAWSMLRPRSKKENDKPEKGSHSIPLLLITGAITGLITGFVGIGGGFLIVPALTIAAGLAVESAIATSLLIIALNSLPGFIAELLYPSMPIRWDILILFSMAAMLGSRLGIKVAVHIPGKLLRKGFGIFLLIMGSVILLKEIFL
jgi:uncharacterized membrane protein YfcA